MSRGIVGAFETWKSGIPYPCMRGDIASTAELTLHEPDDGLVHFARWRPFDQHAVSRSAVPSPGREDNAAGKGGSDRHERLSTVRPRVNSGSGGIGLGFELTAICYRRAMAVGAGATRTLLRSRDVDVDVS